MAVVIISANGWRVSLAAIKSDRLLNVPALPTRGPDFWFTLSTAFMLRVLLEPGFFSSLIRTLLEYFILFSILSYASEPGATGVKNTDVEPAAVMAAIYTLAWLANVLVPKLPTMVIDSFGNRIMPPASVPELGWSIAAACAYVGNMPT
jgi:hypothetical protein